MSIAMVLAVELVLTTKVFVVMTNRTRLVAELPLAPELVTWGCCW